MRSVLKIMWANIKHKKGPFKGIIALMAILTMSFAISLSNYDNTHRAFSEIRERAELGNIVVSIMSDDATDDIYNTLDECEDITSYRVEKKIAFRETKDADTDRKIDLTHICRNDGRVRFFDENGNIKTDSVTISKGEIYLTYKMKNSTDLRGGSRLRMSAKDGVDEIFTVAGFYEDPLHGSILFGNNDALISDEDFDRIYSEKVEHFSEIVPSVYSLDYIFINVVEGSNFIRLKNKLNDECGLIDKANYITDDKSLEMYNSLVSDTGIKSVFVFVALLLIIVMITIKDSIASSIEMDYTSLGILKANGFTKGKVRLIFIIQYLLAVFIGTLIGLLMSIPLTGLLCGQYMKVTCVFTENRLSLGKCILVCLGIFLICILFVTAATHKIGEISPVRAISGGKNDVYFDSRFNLRIHSKPLGFFVALRQITSNIRSYLGSSVIVALLVFFMVCIMVLTKGLDAKTIFSPLNYDITASVDEEYEYEDMERIKEAVHEKDKDAGVDYWAFLSVTIDDMQIYCNVHEGSTRRFLPLEGRSAEYENEVFMTELLAEELGKKIGDTVTLSAKGRSEDFIISGIFQTVYENGRLMEINIDGGKRIGSNYPDFVSVTLSDKSACKEMTDYINDEFKGVFTASIDDKDSSLENIMDTIDTLLQTISYAIYVICIVFAAIVVHMVCAKAFQRERKDIGIYKTIGMQSSQLRSQFAIRFAIVAAVGSAIGCAAALLAAKTVLSALMSMIGLTNFLTDFDPAMLISPSAAMVLSFFVFAYLASSNVKNVQTTELISE